MRYTRKTLGILMVIGVLILFSFSLGHAAIPYTINYQGYLTDSDGNPVNGPVTMKFSLYTVLSGGTAFWNETQSVTVNEGVYSVTLGTVNQTLGSYNFDVSYYLGVTVGTDLEMTPRQPLTSVAYAFTADNALDLVCSSCVSSSDIDQAAIQRRVTGICDVGSSIRVISQDGTVFCETDDAGGTPSNTVTTLDGSSAPGTASEYSRGDHKHGIGTGAVTTTHIQNNTILNGDINASAAISGTKLASDGSVMKSLVAGENISVVNNNNGAWTVNATGTGNDWSLTGNAGTTPGTNFLGTTDNKALEIKVNSLRAMRLEPNVTSPNVVVGYSGNAITAGVYGATISGGGQNESINLVTDSGGTIGGGEDNQAGDNAGTTGDNGYATVGGGLGNVASANYSTISGGNYNEASGYHSTVGGGLSNNATSSSATIGGGWSNYANGDHSIVGGGYDNTASGLNSTVGGGTSNTAGNISATVGGGSGNTASGVNSTVGGGTSNTAGNASATVGGGYDNTASGPSSTVPGGYNNSAVGTYSFAAGRYARANHTGTFVWADSTAANFASTTSDQFAVRASGGVRFQTSKITVNTAKSYLWISGNGVRKFHESDSTIIDMTNFGGAVIQRGATVGNKNVMLPITVMGPLYGQDVKITGLDIYWKGQTEFDGITAVLMRRQTGVCTTSECYTNIRHDATAHGCDQAVYPTGCTLHYDITTGNVLSADSGILYLTIEFAFSSASTQIWIGGVRLTLEHS